MPTSGIFLISRKLRQQNYSLGHFFLMSFIFLCSVFVLIEKSKVGSGPGAAIYQVTRLAPTEILFKLDSARRQAGTHTWVWAVVDSPSYSKSVWWMGGSNHRHQHKNAGPLEDYKRWGENVGHRPRQWLGNKETDDGLQNITLCLEMSTVWDSCCFSKDSRFDFLR